MIEYSEENRLFYITTPNTSYIVGIFCENKLYCMRLVRGKYRDEERPILINNWEATYFDFNKEKILNIAKKAKSVGVELMVLDDG